MPKPVPLPPPGFDDLSVEEKIDYVQSLWDRIAASPETIPLPDWHHEILDERLKDLDANRLWGVDASAEAIELCRRHDRWSRFEVVAASGPTPFPDGAFDLVYSFSVFSHFSETMHARWLEEIGRILQPGGLLLATTRPRDFIEQSALDRVRRPLSPYPAAIAGMFADTRRGLSAYDDGEYCYEALPGLVDWGETCIPQAYVLRHWTKHFTILDYIDDPRRCPQNVIVARRRQR